MTFLGVLLILVGIFLKFGVPMVFREDDGETPVTVSAGVWGSTLTFGVIITIISILFFYADPTYKYFAKDFMGNVYTYDGKTESGWRYYGAGDYQTTPHVATLSLGNDDIKSSDASGSFSALSVRFSDQVLGTVQVTARFELPNGEDYKKLMLDFRDMESIVKKGLKPTLESILESTAKMTTAQDYSTGDKSTFENYVLDQLKNGQYRLKSVISDVDTKESSAGTQKMVTKRNEIMRSEDGSILRKDIEQHIVKKYGFTITQMEIQKVEMDGTYQKRINSQRDAAAQAAVALENAKKAQAEKQRIIAVGEQEKAKKQAELEIIQVEKKIEAQTLAAVENENIVKEENILKQERIKLQQEKLRAAQIDVKATAEANAKRKIFQADGALEKKLEAWKYAQNVWASNIGKHKQVPDMLFTTGTGKGGTGANGTTFMQMLEAKFGQDLMLDMKAKKSN